MTGVVLKEDKFNACLFSQQPSLYAQMVGSKVRCQEQIMSLHKEGEISNVLPLLLHKGKGTIGSRNLFARSVLQSVCCLFKVHSYVFKLQIYFMTLV